MAARLAFHCAERHGAGKGRFDARLLSLPMPGTSFTGDADISRALMMALNLSICRFDIPSSIMLRRLFV